MDYFITKTIGLRPNLSHPPRHHGPRRRSWLLHAPDPNLSSYATYLILIQIIASRRLEISCIVA
jgi:hypothetical protein